MTAERFWCVLLVSDVSRKHNLCKQLHSRIKTVKLISWTTFSHWWHQQVWGNTADPQNCLWKRIFCLEDGFLSWASFIIFWAQKAHIRFGLHASVHVLHQQGCSTRGRPSLLPAETVPTTKWDSVSGLGANLITILQFNNNLKSNRDITCTVVCLIRSYLTRLVVLSA